MAKGLDIPIRPGPNGGSVIVSGDEQASKIIMLALGDDDSDNAFQQNISLGVKMVFDTSSPAFRASVLARVIQIFQVFEKEKLYRLDKTSVGWAIAAGEQILTFRYINLETDTPQTFRRTFPAGGLQQ